MRSKGARSPTVLKSQLQTLSLNQSEISKPNPRTNRQEYSRSKMDDLCPRNEDEPRALVQDSYNSNHTLEDEEQKSMLYD